MSEPLRDVEQAAAWLGIPKKTLQGYVTARTVPFTWVGKHARFAQHHLDAIVAAGEEPVIQPPSSLRLLAATHPPAGPSNPPPPSGPKLPSSLRRGSAA